MIRLVSWAEREAFLRAWQTSYESGGVRDFVQLHADAEAVVRKGRRVPRAGDRVVHQWKSELGEGLVTQGWSADPGYLPVRFYGKEVMGYRVENLVVVPL